MWKYSGLAAAMQRARALGKPWRIGVIAGILIAAIGGAGLAAGAIPDSGGVIHGCYLNKIGTLRVIDSAAGGQCSSLETAIQWNQTGPQGPVGSQGPAGPQGAQGPQGPQGVGADILGDGQTGVATPNAVCTYAPAASTFCNLNNLDASGTPGDLPTFSPSANGLCWVNYWGEITGAAAGGNVTYGLAERIGSQDQLVDNASATTAAGDQSFGDANLSLTRIVSVQAGQNVYFEPWINNASNEQGQLHFNLQFICFHG